MTKQKIKKYLIFTIIAVVITVFFLALSQPERNNQEFQRLIQRQKWGVGPISLLCYKQSLFQCFKAHETRRTAKIK